MFACIFHIEIIKLIFLGSNLKMVYNDTAFRFTMIPPLGSHRRKLYIKVLDKVILKYR